MEILELHHKNAAILLNQRTNKKNEHKLRPNESVLRIVITASRISSCPIRNNINI